jgi:membrane protein
MSSGGPPADDTPSRRQRGVRILGRMVDEWGHDRLPDTAAAVAFWAVLSLLPALLALAAMLGPLDAVTGGDVAQDVQDQVLEFLGTVLTDEASGTIDATRNLFEEQRPGLLTLSLLLAVWTVSRAFAGLVRALDVVYDLDDERGWFHIRATALVIAVGTVLAAAMLLAALVVGPLLGTGEEIAAEVGLGDQFVFLWDVLRLPVAFLVLVLWAATIFHVAPDHRTPWRWDLPGALLTAVLWVVFSVGMRVYLELAQAGNAVFGTLGGALIVLLWFWLLSLAILIGGELNQVLLDEYAPVHGPTAPAHVRHAEDRTDARPDEEREGSDGVDGVA